MKTRRTDKRGRLFASPLEAIGFALLAGVVAASAAMTKEASTAPALLAVDRSDAKITAAEARSFHAAASAATPTAAPMVKSNTSSAPLVDVASEDLAPAAKQPGAIRYVDGRKVRAARTVWMTVTAYSPDHRSCGKWADGITASNKSVWTNGMKLVAADTRLLPFGSLLSVPGYDNGRVVPVLDRGGAIKGARLDVLYPTHAIARRWGVQRLPVTIWEYVEDENQS